MLYLQTLRSVNNENSAIWGLLEGVGEIFAIVRCVTFSVRLQDDPDCRFIQQADHGFRTDARKYAKHFHVRAKISAHAKLFSRLWENHSAIELSNSQIQIID